MPAQTPSDGLANASGLEPVPPKVSHSFEPSYVDSTVNPCQDFYKYACGGWTKKNPVPADEERVAIFEQMNDRNFYLLYKELEQAATSPHTQLQRQYGAFFKACMDVEQVDREGVDPLKPTLASIQALTSKHDLARLLSDPQLRVIGFLTLSVEQDAKDSRKQLPVLRESGLTLPAPDYYLAQGPQDEAIRGKYRNYLTQIFALLGDSPSVANEEAGNVIAIETSLAKSMLSKSQLRDASNVYHPMSLASLQQLMPDLRWQVYFTRIGAPRFAKLNVEQPTYVRTVASVISTSSLSAIKSYLRLHAVTAVAPYLSAPFERASFALFHATLRGQAQEQPRWKSCTVLSDHVLSDAVGQDWIARNFSAKSKADAEAMIHSVREAFREEIEGLPWLSADAKQEALRKLASMREKVGYPGHWRSYSGLHLSPATFLADLHQIELLNRRYELNRIGKAVDESSFYWTVPDADGNYDASLNDIELPAGILQPPRYSPSADAAYNYGGLGTFVGHEITHGFDDEGSHYDEKGNLRNWFTASDRQAFDQMTSCLVQEYSSFQALPDLRLDGSLSVGENTADNGGLRIAYEAFHEFLSQQPPAQQSRKLDGYTPDQRFFLGYAQSWCETRNPEYQRVRGKTDPHPPGEFRVNGSVQNFEQFGRAFECHVGQPMMPRNPCRVW